MERNEDSYNNVLPEWPAILRLPNNRNSRWYQREFWEYFENGGKRGVAIAIADMQRE